MQFSCTANTMPQQASVSSLQVALCCKRRTPAGTRAWKMKKRVTTPRSTSASLTMPAATGGVAGRGSWACGQKRGWLGRFRQRHPRPAQGGVPPSGPPSPPPAVRFMSASRPGSSFTKSLSARPGRMAVTRALRTWRGVGQEGGESTVERRGAVALPMRSLGTISLHSPHSLAPC